MHSYVDHDHDVNQHTYDTAVLVHTLHLCHLRHLRTLPRYFCCW